MSDLPEGRYLARAVSSEFRVLESGELLIVVFEVTEPGDHQGQHVQWNGWFNEKGLDFTKRDLATLGFRASQADWLALCEEQADVAALLPNEVQIKVRHKQGRNRTFVEVQYIDPPGGKSASTHPLDVAQKRSFAARMMAGASAPAAPRAPGTGPAGSTVGQRTSSVDARAQRGGARPAGSGVQEPPAGRFDDDAPDLDF